MQLPAGLQNKLACTGCIAYMAQDKMISKCREEKNVIKLMKTFDCLIIQTLIEMRVP